MGPLQRKWRTPLPTDELWDPFIPGHSCFLEPREALPPAVFRLPSSSAAQQLPAEPGRAGPAPAAGQPAIIPASSGCRPGRVPFDAARIQVTCSRPKPRERREGAGGRSGGCGAAAGSANRKRGRSPGAAPPWPGALGQSRGCSRSRSRSRDALLLWMRNSRSVDVPRLRGRRHRLRFLGLNPHTGADL